MIDLAFSTTMVSCGSRSGRSAERRVRASPVTASGPLEGGSVSGRWASVWAGSAALILCKGLAGIRRLGGDQTP